MFGLGLFHFAHNLRWIHDHHVLLFITVHVTCLLPDVVFVRDFLPLMATQVVQKKKKKND